MNVDRGPCTRISLLFVAGLTAACTIDWSYPAKRNTVQAMNDVRAIRDAERLYFRRHGTYASMQQLAASRPDAVLGELADGEHAGHRLQLDLREDGFVLIVRPLQYGKTGLRSLYLDESGQIRETWSDAVPDTNSERVD